MNTSIATATTIPLGHVFDIDFTQFTPRIGFDSTSELTFEMIGSQFAGMKETVRHEAINVRPGLFVVTWQEKPKATAVQVEEFAQAVVHTNIINPDGAFLRMSGKIQAVVAA
ncbi:MAG TPA: hypothetical protein VFE82_11995 [Ramlibacter sp.]|jgi:hypothetical protein|uniref:MoaF-related domain-containing protein n=1 Tax=Ramlibacter sp. TaxID=1917967 RepID=UPI002D51A24A|nr:hypothetical protein [Ramlibacter sp.]HZY19194.1 hypothetical protein [Ramlibacter sp.]